jgi:hypothetical protein
MIHVQHMEVGPGVDTVANGHFSTFADGFVAIDGRPYGEGHRQDISDTETGDRFVRANGFRDWQHFAPR